VPNSTLQIGQEMYTLVQNMTGSTITNGSPVYIYNAGGSVARIRLADADYGNTIYRFLGVATSNILHGAMGFITTYGDVHDVNTNGMIEGNPVYVSTTSTFTQTKPTKHIARIGYVKYAHATNGIITVQPHYETAMNFAVLNNNATVRTDIDTIRGVTSFSARFVRCRYLY